jgi:hypothetical protein
MKKYKSQVLLFALLLLFVNALAQKERKVTFVGGARSLQNSSSMKVNDTVEDTSTVKNQTAGYALLDLGVDVKPNKNTEIMGMFRIRNQFGGFWGAGVDFQVRQLWLKGVVGNAVRYQVGDLNLKQTEFTLYNYHSDQIDSLPTIFELQKNIVDYERFYLNNNTWRMQGADVAFGFSFAKYISEINVDAFIARLNATDFASTPDRLMGATSFDLVVNKNIQVGYNFNSVFDVKGTALDSNVFKNAINTIDWKLNKDIKNTNLAFCGEVGQSKYEYSYDTLAPDYKDYFVNAYAVWDIKKWNLQATVGYLNVGNEFRSIGAQSKDINYNAQPVYYNRYGNDQQLRPVSLFDVVGNDNIYDRTINSKLMSENVTYNCVLPYGMATYNRLGMYTKVQFSTKKDIVINGEYYNLREIEGTGTTALKHFAMYKIFARVPINKLINSSKVLSVQAGANFQQANRNGNVEIENVDLKNMQYQVGLTWEFIKKFELLGGLVVQSSNGADFTPDRNSYGEIVYYNLTNYDTQQQLLAGGLRYNFTSKIYLAAIFQSINFEDKTNINPDYRINQFGLLFNMLF